MTCTAIDAAGNAATKTLTITATYGWGGSREPVTADGSYKLGSTIPVKFSLAGASGSIGGADARIFISRAPATGWAAEATAVSSRAANTGNTFRYIDGQCIVNRSTKNLSTGTWRILRRTRRRGRSRRVHHPAPRDGSGGHRRHPAKLHVLIAPQSRVGQAPR